MKYTKTVCLVILVSLMTSSLAYLNVTAQQEKCPSLRGNFQYQGLIHEQKFRKKLIPAFYDDETHPLYDIFGGYKQRLFLFCFDSCFDDDEDIDQLVVIYGVGTLRNVPLYSIDFESTELGGVYGLNASQENGIDWETISPDAMNKASPEYNPFHSAVYTLIVNQTWITHTEIFQPRGVNDAVTQNIIYEDWERWGIIEELEDIIFVDYTRSTGNVGTWQQINKDQTVINGNFSTYGPDNPVFVDPQDENNTDLWWPTYNITIAQNIERTSLPRTNSFEINFPFIGVLIAFIVFSTVFVLAKVNRRFRK